MNDRMLTLHHLTAYDACLRREERAPGTREKYRRDVLAFFRWLDGRPVEQELARAWKEELRARGYAPVTVNSMLAALNGLFRFLGWEDCRVKFLRLQRRLFREERRDLTRPEYERLLEAARGLGRERLALLMETICSTGIRRDFSHGKRNAFEPPPDLGGNEAAVQARGGGALQGVSPQPPPFVRHSLLPGLPGHCPSGRPAGPLQHRNHPHLPRDLRRGARPAAGAAGTCVLGQNQHFAFIIRE